MITAQLSTTLRINGIRLRDTLMQQARIGATPEGGVRHPVLTDLDQQGRDSPVAQAEAAGYIVRVDVIGNLSVRRSGHNSALSPVMTGGHIDTQPTGGKFDGNYGVFTGTEMVCMLSDTGIKTEAPIGVVMWTNEEGSRFVSVMMDPGMSTGEFVLDTVLAVQDRNGVVVDKALRDIGHAGNKSVGGRAAGAYFETYIEQGPVLEVHGKTIGVVTGVLGQHRYDVASTGMETHAGPTPMELCRDASLPAIELVGIANRIALERPLRARVMVDCLGVRPDSRNVTSRQVLMAIDFRATDDTVLSDVDAALHEAMAESHTHNGVNIALRQVAYFPPQPFDATLMNTMRSGTRQLGLPEIDVISSVSHDAIYLARVAPTVMISIPHKDDISRNGIEDVRSEHLGAGANVLLHAVLQAAGHV